MERKIRLETII